MRWSYLPPPSPTPSHNSSTTSLLSETNTLTTTGSDTPSLQSRNFFSVIRSSIIFPLSNQRVTQAVSIVVPPPSPPLSSTGAKDNNNGLVGLTYRVDETTDPFTINANTKNNSDNVLGWKPRFKNTPNEYEYETMPPKRRQEAFARVNKLKLFLNNSEKSMTW